MLWVKCLCMLEAFPLCCDQCWSLLKKVIITHITQNTLIKSNGVRYFITPHNITLMLLCKMNKWACNNIKLRYSPTHQHRSWWGHVIFLWVFMNTNQRWNSTKTLQSDSTVETWTGRNLQPDCSSLCYLFRFSSSSSLYHGAGLGSVFTQL